MTRIPACLGVVAAIAIGIAAPAFADSQLAASAGLSPEEAAGMSLTEIAAVKFNNDTRPDDRQSIRHGSGATVSSRTFVYPGRSSGKVAASAGLSPEQAKGMTLTEIVAVKFNNDTRDDDRQTVKHERGVTLATHAPGTPLAAFAQLTASAGLSPATADGLSLTGIAAYKFDRDTY
ncbi:MAG TPA: hypothetical protein VFN28_02345 [Amaricoccus sp.]|nr:hypothetical protein [Amaricoccus sp.]